VASDVVPSALLVHRPDCQLQPGCDASNAAGRTAQATPGGDGRDRLLLEPAVSGGDSPQVEKAARLRSSQQVARASRRGGLQNINLHRQDFEDGPGAAIAIAERTAAAEAAKVSEDIRAVSRNYTELVPTLLTMDDFVAANLRAAGGNRLVVVKFYSKQCRACLRIAAKYRRLALDLHDSVDCYEVESSAAPTLCQRLDVEQVPSVQIFDGEDITRLGMFVCKPTDWKRVDAKVRIAMVSIKKRRGLHKLFGEPLLDILTVPILQ